MKKIATDFLQPADQLIERPPLNWNSFWPSCGIGSFILIVTVCGVGIFTFHQAHTISDKPLPACVTPSKDASCTETTDYPKQLEVSISTWVSVKVILHGPSRLSHSQIEETILGMTCKMKSQKGSLVYHSSTINVPSPFQRICTNPLMPQLTFEATQDEAGLDRIVEHLRTLKKLKEETIPVEFELTDFVIQRVHFDGELMGMAGAEVRLVDGVQFAIWSILSCESNHTRIPGFFARNCNRGAPYFQENVYSHVKPDLCPHNFTDSFHLPYATYLSLISDPSWKLFDPDQKVPETLSIMDFLAAQICEGLFASGISYLQHMEATNLDGQRSLPELIKFITESIDKQCPYSFTCKESVFQGPYMWIVIAYPLLLLVFKVVIVLVRKAYLLLQKLYKKAHPEKQSNENVGSKEDVKDKQAAGEVAAEGLHNSWADQNAISEAVNVAVKQLFGDADLIALCDLPAAISNIEQRLLHVESVLDQKEAMGATFPNTIADRGLDMLPPAPYHCAQINSSVRPPRSEDRDGSLRHMVESLLEEARQAWQNELSLAMQSFEEEIINQLVGVPPKGVAGPRIASKVHSRLSDERHQIKVGPKNMVPTASPHEAQPHRERFPQHARPEAEDPLRQQRAELGARPPAHRFAPGRHYI